jgi:exopolyphosphatase/pppGpp-phosphohydrolase
MESEMKHLIREYVLPFYKMNDNAHKIDHADIVCDRALELNNRLEYTIDKEYVMLAAYLHDIGCWLDRKNHHKVAYNIIYMLRNYIPLLNHMDDAEVELVANACLEHRSSFKGVRTSGLSELLAVADKGVPDIGGLIKRSYDFKPGRGFKDILFHINEKFGTNGYAYSNDRLYVDLMHKEISQLQEDIEAMNNMSSIELAMYCKEFV